MQGIGAALVVVVVMTVGNSGADAEGGADTSFVYAKCNANPIPGGSAFWGNLGTTLHQLVENTAYADFDFKTQNGGANCPAFGEAICDKALTPEDCTDCLSHISNHIWSICNDAVGAEVKFGDCCLRYEQYRF